jgi:hypothetical protein
LIAISAVGGIVTFVLLWWLVSLKDLTLAIFPLAANGVGVAISWILSPAMDERRQVDGDGIPSVAESNE